MFLNHLGIVFACGFHVAEHDELACMSFRYSWSIVF